MVAAITVGILCLLLALLAVMIWIRRRKDAMTDDNVTVEDKEGSAQVHSRISIDARRSPAISKRETKKYSSHRQELEDQDQAFWMDGGEAEIPLDQGSFGVQARNTEQSHFASRGISEQKRGRHTYQANAGNLMMKTGNEDQAGRRGRHTFHTNNRSDLNERGRNTTFQTESQNNPAAHEILGGQQGGRRVTYQNENGDRATYNQVRGGQRGGRNTFQSRMENHPTVAPHRYHSRINQIQEF